MNIYFAPMEGITGYKFRNIFDEMFGGVDKYFTPFISPMEKKPFRNREKRDVDPENNKVKALAPQIITNNAENFCKAAYVLGKYGYKEVNLNLGCPSNTVVAKSKGSGMLRNIARLDEFLNELFEKMADLEYDMEVSVKTRLGLEDPEEFVQILDVYNKYPISELIVHPRVKSELYKGEVHMDSFDYAYEKSKAPLCYNGDITTYSKAMEIMEKYPKLKSIMIGRGLLRDPNLALEIREILAESKISKSVGREDILKFHDRLYKEYLEEMSGERDVIFKMKELWFYFAPYFDNEKAIRKILMAKKPEEYKDWLAKL